MSVGHAKCRLLIKLISHTPLIIVQYSCEVIMKDLSGLKIRKLLVLKQIGRTRNGGIIWECLCDCGKTVSYSSDHLSRKNKPVSSCGCKQRSMKGSNHPQWTGYGHISGSWWRDHVIHSANGAKGRKKLSLTVTIEETWNLFLSQNQKCALTGIDLVIKNGSLGTASLGNVQWVHKHINIMKNKYTEDHFIEMCKLVATNNP